MARESIRLEPEACSPHLRDPCARDALPSPDAGYNVPIPTVAAAEIRAIKAHCSVVRPELVPRWLAKIARRWAGSPLGTIESAVALQLGVGA
jgi:hypothetical protein